MQIVVATREDSWSMLSRAAERKAPIGMSQLRPLDVSEINSSISALASHVIQLGDAVEQLASKDLGLSLVRTHLLVHRVL